jgi:hypothetical protein
MKNVSIRNQLICRIVEDGLIIEDGKGNKYVKNYELIGISKSCYSNQTHPKNKIYALPESILRNFRRLGDEYFDNTMELYHQEKIYVSGNWDWGKAYQFNHQSKTDYVLSDGFIKWLHNEHRKVRGEDASNK